MIPLRVKKINLEAVFRPESGDWRGGFTEGKGKKENRFELFVPFRGQ